VPALILPVEGAYWATRLGTVQEVMARPAITVVPTAPPAVLGLCNRRGDVLPVVSISVLTGRRPLPGEGERQAPWVAVVDTPAGAAGLAVTGVPETVDLGPPVGPGEGPGALSVHRWEVGGSPMAVTLVDPAALVTAEGIVREG
jgi:hypothetical protein